MSISYHTRTPWSTYLGPMLLPPDAFLLFTFSILIYTLFLYMIRRQAMILHNAYAFLKHHNSPHSGKMEDV
uniref:Protein m119.4 n=1 Tax=Mastomys natalensis cytomegalovirus 2 TaxID=2973540 RepID=A0A9Y1ILQ0_9BETA|nr:protein m119.4 [Mastomys natalensis cytomegalovirus 2]WEG69249.1 protein m119.4 [Mastomys natalensis cytomegalovirus 2]WEG69388.1 protein m119.4 [Mastomys natalensis cytomegalovirus 2]WEG69526.1 protein m119.4 [Mastomys natalensis cytomegalovirus 2]WEG69664.1 protein m119.4 [Mastomys natalensis cytomegalovirus 2]